MPPPNVYFILFFYILSLGGANKENYVRLGVWGIY